MQVDRPTVVSLVVIRKRKGEKELLLVCKEGRKIPREKQFWTPPGGEIEAGKETPLVALRRELDEELPHGVFRIDSGFSFDLCGMTPRTNRAVTCRFYLGKGKGRIKPGAEIRQSGWFSYERLLRRKINMSDLTSQIVARYLKG